MAGERTPHEKPPIRRLSMIITKNDYFNKVLNILLFHKTYRLHDKGGDIK